MARLSVQAGLTMRQLLSDPLRVLSDNWACAARVLDESERASRAHLAKIAPKTNGDSECETQWQRIDLKIGHLPQLAPRGYPSAIEKPSGAGSGEIRDNPYHQISTAGCA